ncbi:hypothetical protein [Polyangium jinanense]|uniref:Uncharacterized protein n=1 Tax=Polyangium jinanense TaxID=2829994 RepID=A0A9X4AYV9_9BACT|nr:hypothetical protein [Polyangium jinanense]MDC3959213.1 hypothetical protein [Polyangium jinanense]MDC3987695.1 hypothetical protein [Polyangium jinanense]
MALRLVQAGEGHPRPLVLAFLIGVNLDPKLRAAFGPRPCIVADGVAKGPMMGELLEFAHQRAGVREVSRLALIGYSAGCQRVRGLYLGGCGRARICWQMARTHHGKGKAFCSTARVLRMATGWKLDRAGSVDRPVVTREGALWVYSYASADIDALAHAAQLVRVVPELSARHLRAWVGTTEPPRKAQVPGVPFNLLGILVTFLLESTSRT